MSAVFRNIRLVGRGIMVIALMLLVILDALYELMRWTLSGHTADVVHDAHVQVGKDTERKIRIIIKYLLGIE